MNLRVTVRDRASRRHLRVTHPYTEGNLYRTMRPGETIPQLPPAATQPVPTSYLTIGIKLTDWSSREQLVYSAPPPATLAGDSWISVRSDPAVSQNARARGSAAAPAVRRWDGD
jgi:hypothetical protein